MEHLTLGPFTRASGTVRLPGSKSISNRVLLLAALAEGETRVCDLLDSDDTRVMLQALRTLGVEWRQEEGACVGRGVGGKFPNKAAELFMGNAGTAIRPLTAALALQGGSYKLSGVPRMHERPIGDLVDGLRILAPRLQRAARHERRHLPPAIYRALFLYPDETVGVGVGQRAQQRRVDHTEHRRRGPDAQREGGQRHSREPGALDQHPQAVPDVLEEGIHVSGASTISCGLFGASFSSDATAAQKVDGTPTAHHTCIRSNGTPDV